MCARCDCTVGTLCAHDHAGREQGPPYAHARERQAERSISPEPGGQGGLGTAERRCAQPDSAGEVEIIPTTHADAHQSAAVSFIAILITLPFVIRFATFRIADLMFVKAAATIVAEKITIHSGIGLSTATTPGYKRPTLRACVRVRVCAACVADPQKILGTGSARTPKGTFATSRRLGNVKSSKVA